MAFETKAQSVVYGIFGLLFATGLFWYIGANLYALATCSPQPGKWLPWTGIVCYGDRR